MKRTSKVNILMVLPVLVGVWSIVIIAGCGSNPKSTSKGTAGHATVTYKDDVVPITHMFCRCHIDNPTPPGAYDLTSYEQAMKPGRGGIQIRPGNADSSGLYQRVVSGTMPPTSKLADDDLKILHDWIQQGAQNN